MGVGDYQNLTQWSRGEDTSADNSEGDLTIIASSRVIDCSASSPLVLIAAFGPFPSALARANPSQSSCNQPY